MNACDLLAAELREAGLHCAVEARDRLALLRLAPGSGGGRERLADAGARADVVRLARRHGFTHVAVELADETDDDDDDRAPVRRD